MNRYRRQTPLDRSRVSPDSRCCAILGMVICNHLSLSRAMVGDDDHGRLGVQAGSPIDLYGVVGLWGARTRKLLDVRRMGDHLSKMR